MGRLGRRAARGGNRRGHWRGDRHHGGGRRGARGAHSAARLGVTGRPSESEGKRAMATVEDLADYISKRRSQCDTAFRSELVRLRTTSGVRLVD